MCSVPSNSYLPVIRPPIEQNLNSTRVVLVLTSASSSASVSISSVLMATPLLVTACGLLKSSSLSVSTPSSFLTAALLLLVTESGFLSSSSSVSIFSSLILAPLITADGFLISSSLSVSISSSLKMALLQWSTPNYTPQLRLYPPLSSEPSTKNLYPLPNMPIYAPKVPKNELYSYKFPDLYPLDLRLAQNLIPQGGIVRGTPL